MWNQSEIEDCNDCDDSKIASNKGNIINRNDDIPVRKYCSYLKNSYYMYKLQEGTCPSDEDTTYYKDIHKCLKDKIAVDMLSLLDCKSERKEIHLREHAVEQVKIAVEKSKLLTDDEKSRLIILYVGNPESGNLSAHTVIASLGIVLGLFVILLILYKFTPFGTWMRPQIRRFYRIWNNIKEKGYMLFSDKFESQEINSKNKRYNIAYNKERKFWFICHIW
ncbi:PIR Superfamily Protein [Plasmodium ovale curtisi]|uniref:PIR Superfamily Protein n=1 Tax=Plasmodium ovale curtisi TaxID=864141 RepID=A0A1A8VND6_PLAOA|nr:PIR Superfamily Protein [Plasmodium ovale curtisi]